MIPMIAHIMVPPKVYEVNTIVFSGDNWPVSLRNDFFGIEGYGETMVWELTEDCSERRSLILHCARYSSEKAMIKGHKKIVEKLIDGDTSFFNGDGFPLKRGEDALLSRG